MRKTTNILLIIVFVGLLDGLMYCNDPENFNQDHTYETSDKSFYNGEILLPDYAHLDTLRVREADSLNYWMENYDIATDGDISDVLHAFCDNISEGDKILEQHTDLRGLTSVIYTQGQDTFSLDYLNKLELDSLKNTFR